MTVFGPGATLGVLGNGQLGRMLALAARRMGYHIHTFGPERDSPAGLVADADHCADYTDLAAVRRFAEQVDVVTFEFENIPVATAAHAAEFTTVRPAGRVLHTTQHRLREKRFLASAGLPVAPFRAVASLPELVAALDELGCPAILKTADFGYDGKGQQKITAAAQAAAAWAAVGAAPAVLEAMIRFEREVSVVAARGADGSYADYGAIENRHVNHILDLSLAPAALAPELAHEASALARRVVEELAVVGLLCVEMFVTEQGLIINELAPRPHNSGHLTIEASPTSQFEQQLRAVCGLPLGDTTIAQPAAMANLLGDVWAGGEPNWAAALAVPGVALHLYGKREPRPGRKMGHLTAVAPTLEQAGARALAARDQLLRRS